MEFYPIRSWWWTHTYTPRITYNNSIYDLIDSNQEALIIRMMLITYANEVLIGIWVSSGFKQTSIWISPSQLSSSFRWAITDYLMSQYRTIYTLYIHVSKSGSIIIGSRGILYFRWCAYLQVRIQKQNIWMNFLGLQLPH